MRIYSNAGAFQFHPSHPHAQSSLSIQGESVLVQTDGVVGVCFLRVNAAAVTVQPGAFLQTAGAYAGDVSQPLPFDACAAAPPPRVGQANLWLNGSSLFVAGLVSYSTVHVCADTLTVDDAGSVGAFGLGAAGMFGVMLGAVTHTGPLHFF